MNDDRIERTLREPGPREKGYVPATLPGTLDAPAGRRRRGPLFAVGQFAAVATVVAAGALLAVIVVRPFQSPPGAGSGSVAPTRTPVASSSPAGVAACHPGDLAWTIDPWTGAAGSRETAVVARGVSSLTACEIRGRVHLELRDANGALLSGQALASSVTVRGGMVIEMAVRWSNWCGRNAVLPVTLLVTLPGDSQAVPLNAPADSQGLLPPPCNGSAVPSTLDGQPFAASSRTAPQG